MFRWRGIVLAIPHNMNRVTMMIIYSLGFYGGHTSKDYRGLIIALVVTTIVFWIAKFITGLFSPPSAHDIIKKRSSIL